MSSHQSVVASLLPYKNLRLLCFEKQPNAFLVPILLGNVQRCESVVVLCVHVDTFLHQMDDSPNLYAFVFGVLHTQPRQTQNTIVI